MTFLLSLASGFWLGVLTSISPCPLASNVAAISYLSQEGSHPLKVLISGLLYSLGRTITYVGIGIIIAKSLLTIPDLAFFLQNRMNQFLGPVLILVGAILLGWIRLGFSGITASEKTAARLKALGMTGSLLLGVVFALSFCPVSAGLFFGSLIPIALQQSAPISLPLAYGLGTATPVILFALGIALGLKGLNQVFQKTVRMESWLRKLTGVIFIIVGLYFLYSYLLRHVI